MDKREAIVTIIAILAAASTLSTIARAWAISCSPGVKAALITGTWLGWIASMPAKPSA